jgi:hypothetical protein
VCHPHTDFWLFFLANGNSWPDDVGFRVGDNAVTDDRTAGDNGQRGATAL